MDIMEIMAAPNEGNEQVAAADPLAALPCAKLNVLRQAAPGEPLTPDLCLTAEEMDFYEQENPMTRPQLVQLLRQTEKFGILWKNYMFYKSIMGVKGKRDRPLRPLAAPRAGRGRGGRGKGTGGRGGRGRKGKMYHPEDHYAPEAGGEEEDEGEGAGEEEEEIGSLEDEEDTSEDPSEAPWSSDGSEGGGAPGRTSKRPGDAGRRGDEKRRQVDPPESLRRPSSRSAAAEARTRLREDLADEDPEGPGGASGRGAAGAAPASDSEGELPPMQLGLDLKGCPLKLKPTDYNCSFSQRCAVCGDEESDPENLIVLCDGKGCDMGVHQLCYGVYEVPQGTWKCVACTARRSPATNQCAICPVPGGALKRCRMVQPLQPAPELLCHVACALWHPHVEFGEANDLDDIKLGEIPGELFKIKCSICKQGGGGVVQCSLGQCHVGVHVTCGLHEKLKLVLRDDQRPLLFCRKHSGDKFEAQRLMYMRGGGEEEAAPAPAGPAPQLAGGEEEEEEEGETEYEKRRRRIMMQNQLKMFEIGLGPTGEGGPGHAGGGAVGPAKKPRGRPKGSGAKKTPAQE